jgi:dolichol-phosphate mannosyltransferase
MKLSQQLLSYTIGWIIATFIDISILYCLTDIFHIYYLTSQWISFFISLIFWFLYQKKITFKNSNKISFSHAILFLLFQLIWLWINFIILYISVRYLWLYYIIWSLLSKGIVFLWNFTMNKYFNFS